MTGVTGAGFNQNNPNSAELLENGDILIADENNNRVIEVNRAHQIVWRYGDVNSSALNGAAFASRLPNGDTLITDSSNNRVVQVTQSKNVVFTFYTNTRPGSTANPLPTRAVQVAYPKYFDQRSIQRSGHRDHPHRPTVGDDRLTQGQIGVAGSGFDQLNAPYDAKVIGDYTGLTPPSGWRCGFTSLSEMDSYPEIDKNRELRARPTR